MDVHSVIDFHMFLLIVRHCVYVRLRVCVCVRTRRVVEPVIVRRPEDAHHPGRPGGPDQRRHHPPLGLGHVAPPGGPQAAPALLPGAPQRHRLPQVSTGRPHAALQQVKGQTHTVDLSVRVALFH